MCAFHTVRTLCKATELTLCWKLHHACKTLLCKCKDQETKFLQMNLDVMRKLKQCLRYMHNNSLTKWYINTSRSHQFKTQSTVHAVDESSPETKFCTNPVANFCNIHIICKKMSDCSVRESAWHTTLKRQLCLLPLKDCSDAYHECGMYRDAFCSRTFSNHPGGNSCLEISTY